MFSGRRDKVTESFLVVPRGYPMPDELRYAQWGVSFYIMTGAHRMGRKASNV